VTQKSAPLHYKYSTSPKKTFIDKYWLNLPHNRWRKTETSFVTFKLGDEGRSVGVVHAEAAVDVEGGGRTLGRGVERGPGVNPIVLINCQRGRKVRVLVPAKHFLSSIIFMDKAKRLNNAPLGQASALLVNTRQGWKRWTGTNTSISCIRQGACPRGEHLNSSPLGQVPALTCKY